MAYADNLRSITATWNACATSIEGIFSSGYGLTWSTWTPALTVVAPMAITSVVDVAKYVRVGKLIFFTTVCHGVVSGTPSIGINLSFPANASGSMSSTPCNLSASVSDNGGSTKSGAAYITDATYCTIVKADASNWTAGTATVRVSGFYEAA